MTITDIEGLSLVPEGGSTIAAVPHRMRARFSDWNWPLALEMVLQAQGPPRRLPNAKTVCEFECVELRVEGDVTSAMLRRLPIRQLTRIAAAHITRRFSVDG